MAGYARSTRPTMAFARRLTASYMHIDMEAWHPDPLARPIAATVDREGFAFVRAPEMRAVLERAGFADWEGFAASWDDLGVDMYMADGGRYRRRRFACFRAGAEGVLRKPHQPHYQSRDYNPLNGGIERWFEPVTDAIGDASGAARDPGDLPPLFDRLTPPAMRPASWHVEIHQFRIEARSGQEGRPTPEGHAPRRRRLGAGAAGQPGQHRQRRDQHRRSRHAAARQLYADRSARFRGDRRQPGAFTG